MGTPLKLTSVTLYVDSALVAESPEMSMIGGVTWSFGMPPSPVAT